MKKLVFLTEIWECSISVCLYEIPLGGGLDNLHMLREVVHVLPK